MNEQQAREILLLSDNGSIIGINGSYAEVDLPMPEILIDMNGIFCLKELEAIVFWMRREHVSRTT